MTTVENRQDDIYIWHEMPDEVRERIRIAQTCSDDTQHADHSTNDTNTSESQTESGTSVDGVSTPPSQPEEPIQNGDRPHQTDKEPQPGQGSVASGQQVNKPHYEEPKEGHVESVEEPKSVGSVKGGKTKFTIRFCGAKWGTMLKRKHTGLELAFRKDVLEATGLEEKRILNLQFRFKGVMIATFAVRHQNDPVRMTEAYTALQSCKFPYTVALYPGI